MILSEHAWQHAADHFGIPPDDLPLYREAFDDVWRLGAAAFADALEAELVTALSAVPAPPDVVRRLVIRRTVLIEMLDFVAAEALQNFSGWRIEEGPG
jgi:uncharacterized protein (DUF2236 family)